MKWRGSARLVLLIAVWYASSSLLTGILAGFVAYLATGGWGYAVVFAKTIRRDLFVIWVLIKFLWGMKRNIRENRTLPIIFRDVVKMYPRKRALLWEDVEWTFADLEAYSNAIGNYFYEQGIRKGDNVAIFMTSRPEYVAVWLGLCKIGAVSALINFNLRGDALVHCINIAEPCAVVTSSGELTKAVGDVKQDLKKKLKYYTICDENGTTQRERESSGEPADLDNVLKNGDTSPPPTPEDFSYFDRLMYIYTSGTTGLPKAAVITHSRFYYMCTLPHYGFRYTSDDIVYCALPLYHSNGGVLGLGQCLAHGVTFSFRSKFSASHFWTDCIKHKATVVLYIGEICRYLLAQPRRDTDRQHCVRMATGNGLRKEIWQDFVNRFNVNFVGELYGATEGVANLANVDGKVGACGFISVIAPSSSPVMLIRVDEDMEFIRGPDGLCVKCKPGESGMAVGKVIKNSAMQGYSGYADEKASQKKIVKDVAKKGDEFFISGDILEMDELGYCYFKDRTGDTFRWRGENVSTAECEAQIANALDTRHVVAVYGVQVSECEGRAGMACIVDPERELDMDNLYTSLVGALPSYARPVFVRLSDKVEETSTHKLKKVGLRRQGFDVNEISDPLFYFDASVKKYVRLDEDSYNRIMDGRIRM